MNFNCTVACVFTGVFCPVTTNQRRGVFAWESSFRLQSSTKMRRRTRVNVLGVRGPSRLETSSISWNGITVGLIVRSRQSPRHPFQLPILSVTLFLYADLRQARRRLRHAVWSHRLRA